MRDLKTIAPDWRPPFCPNQNCKYHNPLQPKWPYHKHGAYHRHTDNRRIQRFFCRQCRTSFSTQTFSTSYWQKRPDLDAKIFMKTVGGMANRQIARDLQVDPATVDHKLARLGRHCLLFHDRMMANARPARAIVIDGFESFEFSQYFPFHHNLAIEKGTDFVIYFNDSELRRKGRMRPAQRARRQTLERQYGRPDHRAVEKGIAELLAVAVSGHSPVTVFSDDHPQYRRPLRRHIGVSEHRVTPGREHRDQHNALWEVNLAELLIRHSSANHRRETIAWSKRRQASAERLAIWLVWRNYVCGRRQKDRHSETPAMARGMLDRRLTVAEVLERRLFVRHGRLSGHWQAYYWRAVSTRALAKERRHDLAYAR
jgi:transposase-like protein